VDSLISIIDNFLESEKIEEYDNQTFLLESTKRKWSLLKIKIENQQNKIGERLENLNSHNLRISEIEEIWLLTIESEREFNSIND
jgi:hypothetical protein